MPKVVSNEDEGYLRLLGAIKDTYNHANKVEDNHVNNLADIDAKSKPFPAMPTYKGLSMVRPRGITIQDLLTEEAKNPSPPQVRFIVSLGDLQHIRIIMTERS